MSELIHHNGNLYSIAEKHKGWFYVIKAQPLPTGQTLVQEIRRVKEVGS